MWVAILEAYNNTMKGMFKFLDWLNGRPIARLKEKRIILEDASRAAQITGDVNELRRIRAKIEEIDRDLLSLNARF